MSDTSDTTPLMKQFQELKRQAGDALLFFRMGDFYELFGEDAVRAARILEITLTSRDKNKPNPVPMAGVPHHSAQGYIQRLLKAGHKVAIGEQVEDPASAKGIVRRAVVRTFTPAVQFNADASDQNFLLAALRNPAGQAEVVALDPSTGEVRMGGPWSEDALELGALRVSHALTLGEEVTLTRAIREACPLPELLIESLPVNFLRPERAKELILEQTGLAHLSALGLSPTQEHLLGILLQYTLRAQQLERFPHLGTPRPLQETGALRFSPRSPEHLDLLPREDATPNLYAFLKRTQTSLGARELKRRILAPLTHPQRIRERQDTLKKLASHPVTLTRLRDALAEVYDLDRILGRIHAGLASPRDTLALGKSLQSMRTIEQELARLSDAGTELGALQSSLHAELALAEPWSSRTLREQIEPAPLLARDGGIFARGTAPELDRLIDLSENGERWLVELETRERERTGISSLKVRYNRVFGYYIEITKTHLDKVPADYQRKQSTVGAERFFTEELKRFEEDILSAESKRKALELELFETRVREAAALSPQLQTLSAAAASLDVACALSTFVAEPGWVFPEIDDGMELEITQGRHPLVDRAGGAFVPNSLKLSPETRLSLLITGPNMGGKSTIMRQAALLVILGQMGAPIPASSARWGVFTSIHTRIGAHDAIAKGQSTFMVEMTELAAILRMADARSLIILDEIGRGTSTFDGMSVAWATLEWIQRQLRSRTLFATHYHELTELASTLPSLANAHLAVEHSRTKTGVSLRFLYELREGPSSESFGIHVAQLAGIPKPVVERAWQVLENLESKRPEDGVSAQQLSLFAPSPPAVEPPAVGAEPHPVLEELERADLDTMTPIQALNFLARLRENAQKQPGASA